MTMEIIIILLSFWALSFAMIEMEGPFGWISNARNELMRSERFGVFFFKLLNCYFCTGFWSGIFIYLLHEKTLDSKIIVWGLASAATSFIIDLILGRTFNLKE